MINDENVTKSKKVISELDIPMSVLNRVKKEQKKIDIKEALKSNKTLDEEMILDLFKSFSYGLNGINKDKIVAEKYLDKYIDKRRTNGETLENIYFEVFKNFQYGLDEIRIDRKLALRYLNKYIEIKNKNGETLEWIYLRLFKSFEYNLNGISRDEKMADAYLNNYVSECLEKEDNEELFYLTMFQNFEEGKNNFRIDLIRANKFLEMIKNTYNIEILLQLVLFYKKISNTIEMEKIYYRIYEIFFEGIYIEKNLDEAEKYLKKSIELNCTDKKKKELRELYKRYYTDGNEELCFKKAIQEQIEKAENDYALFLKNEGREQEAVKWYIKAGEYEIAYNLTDITEKKNIDESIDCLTLQTGSGKDIYLSSLISMKDEFKILKTLFRLKPEKSFYTMSILYVVFNQFYMLYRAFKISKIFFFFILSIIIVGGIFEVKISLMLSFAFMIVMIGIDIRKRIKWLNGCRLWNKATSYNKIIHRQLLEVGETFKDAEKVSSKNSGIWAPISLMILCLLSMLNLFFMKL